MTSPTDGGFAFPVAAEGPQTSRGMTLRDWFAGQALNGLLAHTGKTGPAALVAYRAADAMLEARENGKKA